MRTTNWKCDGCGESFENDGSMPDGWAKVIVCVENTGTSADGTAAYDLCSSCRTELGRKVTPTSWPPRYVTERAA